MARGLHDPEVQRFVALVREQFGDLAARHGLHYAGVETDPASADVVFAGSGAPGGDPAGQRHVVVRLDRFTGTVSAEVGGAGMEALPLDTLLARLDRDEDARRLEQRCTSACELGVRVAETARAVDACATQVLGPAGRADPAG